MPSLTGINGFVQDTFGPIIESDAARLLFVVLFAGTIVSACAMFSLSLFYLMVQRRKFATRFLFALFYISAATPLFIIVAAPYYLLQRLPPWMTFALGSGYAVTVSTLCLATLAAAAILVSRNAEIGQG